MVLEKVGRNLQDLETEWLLGGGGTMAPVLG